MHLTRELAKKNELHITHAISQNSHGKSAADAAGGVVKSCGALLLRNHEGYKKVIANWNAIVERMTSKPILSPKHWLLSCRKN